MTFTLTIHRTEDTCHAPVNQFSLCYQQVNVGTCLLFKILTQSSHMNLCRYRILLSPINVIVKPVKFSFSKRRLSQLHKYCTETCSEGRGGRGALSVTLIIMVSEQFGIAWPAN